MTRITAFFDLAGRISRITDGYSHVTVAGVGIPTERREGATEQLQLTPKWSQATPESLDNVVSQLVNAVVLVALRIDRTGPEWEGFWREGKHIVSELRRKVQPPTGNAVRWQFFEPALQARLECFTQCDALLTAETVKRIKIPRVLDQNGLGILEMSPIFDAEIQGDDNLELFHSIWEKDQPSLEQLLRDHWRYVLLRQRARLATEEEEPCLLLADYLAGIVHTYRGQTTRPKGVKEDDVGKAFVSLDTSRRLVESEMRSQVSYSIIMAESPLRDYLAPHVLS